MIWIWMMTVARASLPVVLWHGMGDTADGLQGVSDLIENTLPGTYTLSISLDDDPEADRKASYFGIVFDQVSRVCEQLKAHPALKSGFHAIGFSQGGLFLRAIVETCDVQVHTLMTFGTPHAGVAEPPGCLEVDSQVRLSVDNCGVIRTLIRMGVYWDWIQTSVVQAQYFHKADDEESYLAKCIFLPKLNNEGEDKNVEYSTRLLSLKKLVLVRFLNDTMIVPRDSAWFAFYNTEKSVVKLQDRAIYKQDWIGLKTLEKTGRLDFLTLDGGHMEIPFDQLSELLLKYLD